MAKHFYRPTSAKAVAAYVKRFPPIKLFKLQDAFSGWEQVRKDHFAGGASFDQIDSRR